MAGWKPKKLRDVCELINGRAYKQPELLTSGKYRVLRVGNFSQRPLVLLGPRIRGKEILQDGDLLYAWSASFGPRIWSGGKVIFHYHIWRVVPDPALIDQKFLYMFLLWDKELIKQDQKALDHDDSCLEGFNGRSRHTTPAAYRAASHYGQIGKPFPAIQSCQRRSFTYSPASRALQQAILDAAFRSDLTQDWREARGKPVRMYSK